MVYNTLAGYYGSVDGWGFQAVDTLTGRLLLVKLRLRNIRYYADIVRRNRSQQKFLLGWITWALN